MYINRSAFLKLCRGKPSGTFNALKAPLPTPSTNPDPIQNKQDNPRSTFERPPTLPLVLASFTLHDVSTSQEKSGVVIPIIISSQSDHIPCSALVDTGSPVTLVSEKMQHQLNYPATPLESYYHLVGATSDTLTTLGTVQVDMALDRKILPTPAIIVSLLAHLVILGLNFLKLTKFKIDFETNNVEIGLEIYPADMRCITSSISTIIITTSDVYRPCQLLPNKKACWMVTITLIIVIVLTTVVSHTHCHLKPPLKKHEESFASPARNFVWKELLTYGTSIRFSVATSELQEHLPSIPP